MIDRPILITGCARSGTSMVAGIVHLCGAWKGETTGASRHNAKGQFENREIRDGITKPYLRRIKADHMGQKPLPDTNNLMPYDLKSPVLDIIRRQGYDGSTWMYKGAKLCLVWPLWHQAFPDARWIIVRRPDKDIITSCLRTIFMRAYKDRRGWQTWVDEHKKRFDDMQFAGLDVYEIWSNEIVKGDLSDIRATVNDIAEQSPDMAWNEEAVKDFVSPELYHT